jgi:hypothetical protein
MVHAPSPIESLIHHLEAILLNKLKNYLVTVELILAGDENLTPNQNIEIFSAVYSFIRSTQRFN